MSCLYSIRDRVRIRYRNAIRLGTWIGRFRLGIRDEIGKLQVRDRDR